MLPLPHLSKLAVPTFPFVRVFAGDDCYQNCAESKRLDGRSNPIAQDVVDEPLVPYVKFTSRLTTIASESNELAH
jgi:hypothetical protein